jgi:hypothetical protein
MAIMLTCSCGKMLRVKDDVASDKVACPKCQAVLSLAEHREKKKKDSVPPPPAPDDEFVEPVFDDASGTIPTAAEEYVEVAPERVRRTKKQRKRSKARREGLEKLSFGLYLHLAGPFLFLPAMWTGWLALALLLLARNPDLSEAMAPVTFLEITSGIFLILSALVEIPTVVLCLRVPDGTARGLLIGSAACRLLGFLFAVLLMFLADARAVMLALAFATTIASWALWMCFLARVGRYLGRPEFTSEALRTMASGLTTLIATVFILFLIMVMIMLIVWIKILFARYALFVTSVSVFLACVRIAIAVGRIDSVVGFFLAPTGIPFIFNRHLSLVSSLRGVLERRI